MAIAANTLASLAHSRSTVRCPLREAVDSEKLPDYDHHLSVRGVRGDRDPMFASGRSASVCASWSFLCASIEAPHQLSGVESAQFFR
jgi:hypothetical protein